MQSIQENNLKEISISILGCGWLGLPLGKMLAKKGYAVSGSTTSTQRLKEISENNISPFLINLETEEINTSFFDSNILIVCFPPRLRTQREEHYWQQINALTQILETKKETKILFTSSTSVYNSENREMKEVDANIEHPLFKAEEILRKPFSERLTILRLSGLMGYGRIPCKYYAGKKGLTNGNTPVNYLFRDDVIHIIEDVISKNIWEETINITAPIHPSRKEVMASCCQKQKFEEPEFIEPEKEEEYKIINGDKLEKLLNYNFLFPNPLDFPY